MHIPKAKKLPSGSWFCRVRIDGSDIGITKPTEKEAIAEAMALKAGLKRVAIDRKKHARRTLRICIDDYISRRADDLSPATIAGYRVIQRNRMPTLMDREVSRLTERLIQQSISAEAKRLSPKTIANTYGLLSSVLADEGVDIDWRKIRLPKKQKPNKRIYEREEIQQLLAALRGSDIEAPILLGLMLGLRRSEICALRWEDIDFERRTIHVCRARVYAEDGGIVEKGTKTEGSDRILPNCPPYLMSALSKLPRTSEYVCPLTPAALSHRFECFLQRNDLPHIGLHALRHTYASVMLSTGAPDKYVMDLGGWSTPAIMKDVYQHTMDDTMRVVTTTRNDYFAALAPSEESPKPTPRKYKIVRFPENLKNGSK